MATTLLDALAEAAGFSYLSDLLQVKNNSNWIYCLNAIPEGSYPLSQWIDALRYLSGDNRLTAADETEARQILCGFSGNIPSA